jgi:hypothetical protein
MFRGSVRPLLGHLKRALRLERRLTVEQCYSLLELSEAIIDHGRMLQSYYERPLDYVMVEIHELGHRLRETPETVTEALLLLKDMGRAEPYDQHGRWRLHLADTLVHGRNATGNAESVQD